MDDLEPVPFTDFNPISRQKHRHEVFWQVSIPFVLICFVLSVLAILAASASYIEASKWADISVIYLIVPMMIFALLAIVIQVASVYALIRLMQVLPFYSYRGHGYLLQIGMQIEWAGNQAVRPFVGIKTSFASLRAFGRSVRSK